MGAFYAGLDLGQTNDYTALCIIERVENQAPETPLDAILRRRRGDVDAPPAQYHLRHLERPAIGTPYTNVVRRVCDLLTSTPELRDTPLVIDRTGVGRAVYDMFALAPLRGGVVPISIHGGDTVIPDGNGYRVPKRDLVGVLQALLQPAARRLLIARDLSLGPTFAAEAQNFKAKISLAGHDSYEAGPAGEWREGAHDDLVLSVALACWYAERPGPRIWFFDDDAW